MNTPPTTALPIAACPFCGKKPALYQGTWEAEGKYSWIIECVPCMFQLQYGKKKECIDAWNRRTPAVQATADADGAAREIDARFTCAVDGGESIGEVKPWPTQEEIANIIRGCKATGEVADHYALISAAEGYLEITADHTLRHGRSEALEKRRVLVAALKALRKAVSPKAAAETGHYAFLCERLYKNAHELLPVYLCTQFPKQAELFTQNPMKAAQWLDRAVAQDVCDELDRTAHHWNSWVVTEHHFTCQRAAVSGDKQTAHSKSEFKRLSALGAEVLPPGDKQEKER